MSYFTDKHNDMVQQMHDQMEPREERTPTDETLTGQIQGVAIFRYTCCEECHLAALPGDGTIGCTDNEDAVIIPESVRKYGERTIWEGCNWLRGIGISERQV